MLEGVLNTTHKLKKGSVNPPILLQLILDCSGVLGSDRIDDYLSPLRTLERQSEPRQANLCLRAFRHDKL